MGKHFITNQRCDPETGNMTLPFISVIIPCRNEERFVGRALDSLIANDYPKDRMEILVIDGQSNDRTRDAVEKYVQKHSFIKILDNPGRTTPIAMNIGIKQAKGDLVTKSDAHSIYPRDYLSKCALYISSHQADAVGGIALAVPSVNTKSAQAIALSLGSSLGAGGNSFRTQGGEPRLADTAFGTCYKKDVFRKIGLFNENLTRSQDMDLNLRLKKFGGKILLAPDIVITYYPNSILSGFFKHNVSDGVWAILPLKFRAEVFRLKHFAPLAFILGLAASIVLGFIFSPFWVMSGSVLAFYSLIALSFSLRIAAKEKKLFLTPFLFVAFSSRHFGYGLGSLVGLFKLLKS